MTRPAVAVIDDDLATYERLHEAMNLRCPGVLTVGVATADEALNATAAATDTVFVLVCGESDAAPLAALAELLDRRPSARVVVLTPPGVEPGLSASLQMGAAACVARPVSTRGFADLVDELSTVLGCR